MKCKSHDIVPKDLILKAPYHSQHSSKITLRASKALLRDRIQLHRFKKAALNKQIDLESFFQRSTNQSDQLRIMAAVESSFKHYFLEQKEIQIQKSSALKDHHQTTCHQFIRVRPHRIGRMRA
jgi:hypothetical protein